MPMYKPAPHPPLKKPVLTEGNTLHQTKPIGPKNTTLEKRNKHRWLNNSFLIGWCSCALTVVFVFTACSITGVS